MAPAMPGSQGSPWYTDRKSTAALSAATRGGSQENQPQCASSQQAETVLLGILFPSSYSLSSLALPQREGFSCFSEVLQHFALSFTLLLTPRLTVCTLSWVFSPLIVTTVSCTGEDSPQQGLAKHTVLFNNKPSSPPTHAWRQRAFHPARASGAVLTSAKSPQHSGGKNAMTEQLEGQWHKHRALCLLRDFHL